MKFLQTLVASAALILSCQAAQAAPVALDFDGVTGFALPLEQNGFKVAGSAYWWQTMVGNSQTCYPRCADNGTNYLLALQGSFTVSAADGNLFSLQGFDGAETFSGHPALWARNIQVLGTRGDGSTVLAEFALDGLNDGAGPGVDFQQFLLPSGFSDLKSVLFSGTGQGYNSFALDNILLDNGRFGGAGLNNVPEPGSLLLAGLALAGMALSRRRAA